MERRARARTGRGAGLARAIALAAFLLAFAGLVVVFRDRARPPEGVWTLRAPDAPGHASLTVHESPAGRAVPGRWILVDGEGVDRKPDVVLVRLPLEDRDGVGALVRLISGGELLYRASGGTAETPGGFWYGWTRE